MLGRLTVRFSDHDWYAMGCSEQRLPTCKHVALEALNLHVRATSKTTSGEWMMAQRGATARRAFRSQQSRTSSLAATSGEGPNSSACCRRSSSRVPIRTGSQMVECAACDADQWDEARRAVSHRSCSEQESFPLPALRSSARTTHRCFVTPGAPSATGRSFTREASLGLAQRDAVMALRFSSIGSTANTWYPWCANSSV